MLRSPLPSAVVALNLAAVPAARPYAGTTFQWSKIKHVDEPQRRTITRRSDEPKLEIGDTISIKEGVVGVILARYSPSGTTGEVRYIVELRDDQAARGEP